jgi:hypothetical protein
VDLFIDVELADDGRVIGHHGVRTDVQPQNKMVDPTNPANTIDVITFLVGLHKGTIPIRGTGFELISQHPLYVGKTRLDAVRGEMVRRNDAAARAALGI